MKHGKKYTDSAKLLETGKQYDLSEAVELVKQTAKAKFDETIELSVRLGVDPRHADQQVRGAVVLPHGTGKKKCAFWYSAKRTKKRKHRLPAQISSAAKR